MLVRGPRVLGENLGELQLVVGRSSTVVSQVFGEDDLEAVVFGGFGEAVGSIRMRVGIREIRLDVEYRCAVQEVCTGDNEFARTIGHGLDAQETYGRESQAVRTEGAAGRKDADAGIAAQARGTDG